MDTLSPAMETVEASFAEAAKAAVEHAISARSRAFARDPRSLDILDHRPGKRLSQLPPRKMRARIEELIADEFIMPRRWFGFGGEVPLIVLNGARRYADHLIAIDGIHQ